MGPESWMYAPTNCIYESRLCDGSIKLLMVMIVASIQEVDTDPSFFPLPRIFTNDSNLYWGFSEGNNYDISKCFTA